MGSSKMQKTQCPCTGETLDRLLRPTVMAVLAEAPDGLHGYLVLKRLGEVPMFKDHLPDATGLYRVLKTMGTEGYLSSEWDVEGSGPAKHVYRLTDEGRDCLRRWSETLESYAKTLQKTVVFIRHSLTVNSEG